VCLFNTLRDEIEFLSEALDSAREDGVDLIVSDEQIGAAQCRLTLTEKHILADVTIVVRGHRG
jgi:hypothetical protein